MSSDEKTDKSLPPASPRRLRLHGFAPPPRRVEQHNRESMPRWGDPWKNPVRFKGSRMSMNRYQESNSPSGGATRDVEEQPLLRDEGQTECMNDTCWEDRLSMIILLGLYTLQGIPMGLGGSIPILMKERGASFEELAMFSMVSLPFSLKLLWAPFVDSVYIRAMGRRKTWLIPVQLLCGVVMMIGALKVNSWLGGESGTIEVLPITLFFIFLYFLMATQDIAVDGWCVELI